MSALAASGAASFAAQEETTTQTQETSYLRVGHFSPDAPAVNVSIDNETVVENAVFGDVTGYLALESGEYNATITVADQPNTVLFEGNLTLEPRTVGTLAASGEFSTGSQTDFEPVLFEDNAWEPDNDSAAVSLVHLSPDAPAVDVVVTEGPTEEGDAETETETETATDIGTATETGTAIDVGTATETGTATDVGTATETATDAGTTTETAQGSPTATTTSTPFGATDTATEAGATGTATDTVGIDNLMPAQQEDDETYLARNLTFQNASDYVNVPAGDYTVEIRTNDTEQVVATVDLSVEGGTAYSVFAAGYATPADAPAGSAFTVIPVEDATMTVSLPDMMTETETAAEDETGTETETGMETATDDGTATETDAGTDTATDTGTDTATDTGTDTATDTGVGTATDTGTDTATDTGVGTATDTGTDTATDTGVGTATDTGTDTATEAGA
ncbi:hypothetical protein C475_11049 [Halosimplex carlsbadense 2-9-1]|uniref:DUF4397 domain-containing protein n=1 Tax=Halosimplex carlsbadense 2-9-1 TaxID=797114 RepID=M0CT92_9EURY|nr:hypothetical protein C475_11049 [Halosimplex carlsbadense 2-9-1]